MLPTIALHIYTVETETNMQRSCPVNFTTAFTHLVSLTHPTIQCVIKHVWYILHVYALQMLMSALQMQIIANNCVSIPMDRSIVIARRDLHSAVMVEHVEYLVEGLTLIPQVVFTLLVGLSTIL